MADVITRLKVESSEYDAKIKRAASGLLQMEEACRKVDGTLAILEKEEKQFVESLGSMETVSKTARGRLNELTQAFTDLSIQYKRLTDEEKKGDYGQALSKSLEQLKSRIQDAKKDLDDVNKELGNTQKEVKGTGSVIEQLAGKFGLSTKALTGWGAAIAAAGVALKVSKDAFLVSEANVDEWGRTMDESKSLYEGFLNALNTGDISGYLSNINDIVTAAKEAYNELDRLGTMQTIQAPQKSAQQLENDRIRQMIRTGRYIAPIDGRKPTPGMKNGQLLTPDQIKRLEQQLQGGMNKMVGLVGNEVKQTGKAIDAVYNRQAKELGMSLSEFRKGTSSMAEFDKRIAGAQAYRDYENLQANIRARANSGINISDEEARILGTKNPNSQYKGWDVFRVDGERYNKLVQLIQQRDQQAGQAYNLQSQAYQTINRAEGITTRNIMGGSGGSGGGGKTELVQSLNIKDLADETWGTTQSMKELQQQLANYKNMLANATDQFAAEKAQAGITQTERLIAAQPTALKMGISVEAAADMMDQVESIKDQIEEGVKIYLKATMDTESVEDVATAAKAVKINMKDAASMVNTLGTALSAIEDPGAKVAATVAQAIATIAMAYSDALAKDSSSKFNIWSFIAAAAAATVSMATTIASIHSATGYAEGGIIKGNTYSGDQIPADSFVNAGELVLNKAQQLSLASQLTERSGGGGGASTPYVTGEKIVLGINNYGKKQGWGELVFSRR